MTFVSTINLSVFIFFMCAIHGCGSQTSSLSGLIDTDERGPVTLIPGLGSLGTEEYSICTAIAVGSNRIVTTEHCLLQLTGATIFFHPLNGPKVAVQIERTFHDADIAFLNPENPLSSFSKGIWDNPPLSSASFLVGYDADERTFRTSRSGGQIEELLQDESIALHTFDTVYGTSGAPLLNQNGEVLGIHIGYSESRDRNVAVMLHGLNTANVRQIASIPEVNPIVVALGGVLATWAAGKIFDKVLEYYTEKDEKDKALMFQAARQAVLEGEAGRLIEPVMKKEPVGLGGSQLLTFGGNHHFHLGDNSYADNSNCAERIKRVIKFSQPLNSLTFKFKIETPTSVTITINDICGITQSPSARISGVQNWPLHDGTFKQKIDLPKGNHELIVNTTSNENHDLDDFIFGKVQIEASGGLSGRGLDFTLESSKAMSANRIISNGLYDWLLGDIYQKYYDADELTWSYLGHMYTALLHDGRGVPKYQIYDQPEQWARIYAKWDPLSYEVYARTNERCKEKGYWTGYVGKQLNGEVMRIICLKKGFERELSVQRNFDYYSLWYFDVQDYVNWCAQKNRFFSMQRFPASIPMHEHKTSCLSRSVGDEITITSTDDPRLKAKRPQSCIPLDTSNGVLVSERKACQHGQQGYPRPPRVVADTIADEQCMNKGFAGGIASGKFSIDSMNAICFRHEAVDVFEGLVQYTSPAFWSKTFPWTSIYPPVHLRKKL